METLLSKLQDNCRQRTNVSDKHCESLSESMRSLFLPLSRLFPFCKDINRLFKGVNHDIQLENNSDNNIIHKTGASNYKFQLNPWSWWIPKVVPSLVEMAKLETALASGFATELYWESAKVYKSDVKTTTYTEVDWIVTTSHHRPSHIFIIFQKQARNNSQGQTNMVFDHINLERLRVKLNDTKEYPENELTCNFTPEQMDYSRVYTTFLAAALKTHDVDSGTVVSYTDLQGYIQFSTLMSVEGIHTFMKHK